MARTSDVLDEIIALIGHDAAEELCRAFGGQRIYLPGFRQFAAERRNQQIVADLKSGMSMADAARKHGVSWRQIVRIRNDTFCLDHVISCGVASRGIPGGKT